MWLQGATLKAVLVTLAWCAALRVECLAISSGALFAELADVAAEEDAAVLIVPSFRYQDRVVDSAQLGVVRPISDGSARWGQLRLEWDGKADVKVFSVSLSSDAQTCVLTCRTLDFSQSSAFFGSTETRLRSVSGKFQNTWGGAVSPNGNIVAFFGHASEFPIERADVPREYSLVFLNARTGSVEWETPLRGFLDTPMDRGLLPSWSADGDCVVFSVTTGAPPLRQGTIMMAMPARRHVEVLTQPGTAPILDPLRSRVIYGATSAYLVRDRVLDVVSGRTARVPWFKFALRSRRSFDVRIADYDSCAAYPLVDFYAGKYVIGFGNAYCWVYSEAANRWARLCNWPGKKHRYGLQALYIKNTSALQQGGVLTWETD